MKFFLSDTFLESLRPLQPREQKAVNATVQKFFKDLARPGLNLEKLHQAHGKHFHSIRVTRDLRIILHRQDDAFVLCHAGHHDEAYAWAERRKIEEHPQTGAMQIVSLPETIATPPPLLGVAEQPQSSYFSSISPPIFLTIPKDNLLKIGVPSEWLESVHNATEADCDWMDHVPGEAAEALFDYLKTGTLEIPPPVAVADPFDHPDARRRFRVIESEDELARALNAPWAQWTLFLHPRQRSLVEREYDGPALIAGAAGTGKTIVALHRAVHLAHKNPRTKILLTSLSRPLVTEMEKRIDALTGDQPALRRQIVIRSLPDVGHDLFCPLFGKPKLVDDPERMNKNNSLESIKARSKISAMLEAIAPADTPMHLLRAEWNLVADPWQPQTLDAYRNAPRIGNMPRPAPQQYEDFWGVFAQLRAQLKERGLLTAAEMFSQLVDHFAREKSPFDSIIADEAQDIPPPQMRLLSVLSGGRPNGLFLCADLGQRIFQAPFSWNASGVSCAGRVHILRRNYRTSRQIQQQTERLLPRAFSDVDGIRQTREGGISPFNSPAPHLEAFDDEAQENTFIADWIRQRLQEGVNPDQIAIFVRYAELLSRTEGIAREIDPAIVLSVMQDAKGLEFRAVVIMNCSDTIIPSQERMLRYAHELGIEEIHNTERQLLYVAATRAREHLLITGLKPVSSFLKDLTD